jgi:hypothetical protein
VNPENIGVTLVFSCHVKCLGVILDSKSTWNQQMNKATTKSNASLMMVRRVCGKTWGLSPKICYWLPTVVVRPIITYAAVK